MTNIEQLIEKHKGERTYFDHELLGAYFTVQNLENLIADCVTEQLLGKSEQLEQKPVAWILNGTNLVWSIYPDYVDVEPLYTRPTKRLSDEEQGCLSCVTCGQPATKPLSDDKIVKELERTDEYTGKSFFAGVRWAEKAHGVGE